MSVKREGGCACGAVRYRLTSDPLFTHCCHCLNCQRQTGSAFVINLLIEADRVQLLAGDPQPVAVPREGGKKQKIWRCPTCQVAVFSQYTRRQLRFVRGGTLDDPAAVTPDVHIFTRSRSLGSSFRTPRRRSRSTTTRRSFGRPQVSSASRRSWRRRATAPEDRDKDIWSRRSSESGVLGSCGITASGRGHQLTWTSQWGLPRARPPRASFHVLTLVATRLEQPLKIGSAPADGA